MRYSRLLILIGLMGTPLEVAAQPRHGMWVYGIVPRSPTSACTPTTTLLDEDPNAVQLLALTTANSTTEVYLALGMGAAALSDSRFPNFVRQLKSGAPNGAPALKVEALVGCAGSECAGNAWRMQIGQVLAYNDRADPLERFDGLHLDLEPWLGTTDDYSWVDPLIDYYRYASSTIDGSGLTLAADMSGTKIYNSAITTDQRQALLNLATRMVLMEYEVTSEQLIHERVDRFRSLVDLSTAFFAVATRVQDFGAANGCQNGAVLKGFDDSYTPAPGYSGWSTFKYSDSSDCNHYNDPNVCPGDCCLIQVISSR